jgi:hypothetical protein
LPAKGAATACGPPFRAGFFHFARTSVQADSPVRQTPDASVLVDLMNCRRLNGGFGKFILRFSV